jgi:hypothetical protein
MLQAALQLIRTGSCRESSVGILPERSGPGAVVRYDAFIVEEIDGKRLTPAQSSKLPGKSALLSLGPSFRVDADGCMIDGIGLYSILKHSLAVRKGAPAAELTEGQVATLSQLDGTETDDLEEFMRSSWRTWVEVRLGVGTGDEFAPHGRLVFPSLDPNAKDVPVTFEHPSALAGDPKRLGLVARIAQSAALKPGPQAGREERDHRRDLRRHPGRIDAGAD